MNYQISCFLYIGYFNRSFLQGSVVGESMIKYSGQTSSHLAQMCKNGREQEMADISVHGEGEAEAGRCGHTCISFTSLARLLWNAAACVSAASLALPTVGLLRTSCWMLKLFLFCVLSSRTTYEKRRNLPQFKFNMLDASFKNSR